MGEPTHAITHGPSFAMLRVDLAPGETVVAETGAMVARHPDVSMEVRLNAGRRAGFFAKLRAFFVALLRKLIGGETFFVNHFHGERAGSVWLAPALSGQIVHRQLEAKDKLVLVAGAYLASTGEVDMRLKWGGMRGVLSKEGLFFLEMAGPGDLWFTSYGGIVPIDVRGSYVIDNGHLVGFEGDLRFKVRTAGGGMLGLVASGEGLVCEFSGTGRVYVQSRNVGALAGWLAPLLG